MVQIRRADVRDQPAIVRLWSELATHRRSLERVWPRRWAITEPFERTYARLLAPVWDDPQQVIFIAEEGAQPVGFVRVALVEPDPSPAHIEPLAVTASHRGRGVGRALMQAALTWCVEREADEVSLEVLAANTGAVRFFERLSFNPVLSAYFRPASAATGAEGQAPVAAPRPAQGTIRRAGAADAAAVVRMWDAVRGFHRDLEPHWPRRWATPPPDILSRLIQELQAYWSDHRKAIFVCDTGQELAGFVRIALMDSWLCPGQVQSLYIRDDHRGQGLGQVLMAQALAWCAAHGAAEVGLHVSASNAGAARFYARLGFRPLLSTYFRALPAAGSGDGESTA